MEFVGLFLGKAGFPGYNNYYGCILCTCMEGLNNGIFYVFFLGKHEQYIILTQPVLRMYSIIIYTCGAGRPIWGT